MAWGVLLLVLGVSGGMQRAMLAALVNLATVKGAEWASHPDVGVVTRVEIARTAYWALASAEDLMLFVAPYQAKRLTSLRTTLNNFLSATTRDECDAAADSLWAGIALERNQEFSHAAAMYRDAYLRCPFLIDAYVSRYRVGQTIGDKQEMSVALLDLQRLMPTYPQPNRAPVVEPIGQDRQVRLIGYDVLNARLIGYTNQVQVLLYWQIEPSCGETLARWSDGIWTWTLAGERLYQEGAVTNMVPNPGFEELDLGGSPRPAGWQGYVGIGGWSVPVSEVHQLERDGRPTKALKVLAQERRGAVATESFDLNQEAWLYIYAGSLRVEESVETCITRDDGGFGWDRLVCLRDASIGWQAAGAVVRPADGARQWLLYLEVQGEGAAYFDDLVFAPLVFRFPARELEIACSER